MLFRPPLCTQARVNIDIFGISELKWTRKGEFNSDDHYIYYCGQESFRRNGVTLIVNKKSPKHSTWIQSPKRQNDLCSFTRQTIQYQRLVYDLTSNAEEAEVEWFYEDLQDLLEITPKKDVLFIIGDWNAKVRSQEIPGITGKFGLGVQNEAGQRLTEFCQETALVIAKHSLPATQEKTLYMDITRWSISKSDSLYSLQAKMGKLYSQQKQDSELTVAQILNSLLPNSDLN